jgi:hypothetical protein
VLTNAINNLQKLQQDAVANVGLQMLINVFNNLNGRVHCCLKQDEHHFEHFLNYLV